MRLYFSIVTFYLFLIAVVTVVFLAGVNGAFGHEHDTAIPPEEARVYEFYSEWSRPKGNFQGIGHRTESCCNRRDCFPVVEARIDRGALWIRVQYPNGDVSGEYRVDPAIIESNQEDPRESPDPRSHACIIGGAVACYVEGGGA